MTSLSYKDFDERNYFLNVEMMSSPEKGELILRSVIMVGCPRKWESQLLSLTPVDLKVFNGGEDSLESLGAMSFSFNTPPWL